MFPSHPSKKNKQRHLCSRVMEQHVTENQERGHGDPCLLFLGKQGCPSGVEVPSSSSCPNGPGLGSLALTQKSKGSKLARSKSLKPELLSSSRLPPCPCGRDSSSHLAGGTCRGNHRHHRTGARKRMHTGGDWKKRHVCYRFGNLYLGSNYIH